MTNFALFNHNEVEPPRSKQMLLYRQAIAGSNFRLRCKRWKTPYPGLGSSGHLDRA
jgi:hypothetical protein